MMVYMMISTELSIILVLLDTYLGRPTSLVIGRLTVFHGAQMKIGKVIMQPDLLLLKFGTNKSLHRPDI